MNNSASALRRSTISMLAFLAATALWAVILPGIASAVTFTVNRNDDIAPRGTGVTCSGATDDCTLREAVIKLNATAACAPPAAACIINFAATTNGTHIQLTITSTSNAADASTGDLDINTNVEIQGNGPRTPSSRAPSRRRRQGNKIFGITGRHAEPAGDHRQREIGAAGTRSCSTIRPSPGRGRHRHILTGHGQTVLSNCVITDNTNVHATRRHQHLEPGPLANPNNGTSTAPSRSELEISNNHELGRQPEPQASDVLWRRDLHRFWTITT